MVKGKKYSKILSGVISSVFLLGGICVNNGCVSKCFTYKDASFPIEKRVNDLLDRMTLDEMIGQLNLLPYYESNDSSIRESIVLGRVGALLKADGAALNLRLQRLAVDSTRLGIPLMFHEDVIHGYRTIFPIPLAMSCTWNDELVEKASAVAAAEASSSGIQLTYAPMVDISNDPRWGRIMETMGEDPYLCSRMAAAQIRGFQGNAISDHDRLASCVKHFAGYASLSAGRDYLGDYFSERMLREVYLKPYEAAIHEGVSSFMCSYTMFEGVPATHSRHLNTEILRGDLGFDGLLMTDWRTLSNAIASGAAPDDTVSSLRGILSGIEMDMTSECYSKTLKYLVESGQVSETVVRRAAYHALKLKFEAGLFDDPYGRFDENRESAELLSPGNKSKAEEVAASSMVLLKNDHNVLPLNKERIVLVGPYVAERASLMGSWCAKGVEDDVRTLEESFRDVFPGKVVSLPCGFDGVTPEYVGQATRTASLCDVAVVCVGEPNWLIGEAVSTSRVELSPEQEELVRSVRKVCGKVVVVLFNGRPLVTKNILDNCDALLEAWYPGTMGAEAVASIISGERNPSGRLTQTFPRSVGQIPVRYNELRTFADVDFSDLEEHGPQFPFGYGLSYTDWEYSSLEVSSANVNLRDSLKVSVNVRNVGPEAGRETVQLYLSYPFLDVIPRKMELRRYSQVDLAPGESETVVFTLCDKDFEYLGPDGVMRRAEGGCRILVGHDSSSFDEVFVNLAK